MQNGIKDCRSRAGLEGKIIFTLTIGTDGIVKDIKVASGYTQNKAAEQCIEKIIKKWKFPENNNGKEARATVTFLF